MTNWAEPWAERLGDAARRITITWDRVCYGCGCWRDLHGTLRRPDGPRGRACRAYHKRLSAVAARAHPVPPLRLGNMATNPGEWYAEKAAEAERLEAALAAARRERPPDAAKIRRLTRALELARYVGD